MTLRLEPESAALSILRRIELIDQCRAYIAATVERYDGLRAFEAELAKHGIKDRIDAIVATESATEGSDDGR